MDGGIIIEARCTCIFQIWTVALGDYAKHFKSA